MGEAGIGLGDVGGMPCILPDAPCILVNNHGSFMHLLKFKKVFELQKFKLII